MRAGRLLILTAVLGAILGVITVWWAVSRRAGTASPAPVIVSVPDALEGGGDGFTQALAPHPFLFPVDHGPHAEYRTEWWYYTGHLDAVEGGRTFGFQLAFFRAGLVPWPPARPSAWATREVYLAHFAMTDVATGRFHAHERWSRDALGLAGASGTAFRVWVEDWSAEGAPPASLPMRLRAAADEIGVDLLLDGTKPPVLQADRGLWRIGTEPGVAWSYYSLTRMHARGTVRTGGRTVPVQGLAWMDRMWGPGGLGPGRVGWDWFGLQLADGRELMLCRVRLADGTVDPTSFGTLVDRDGAVRRLGPEDVHLEVLGHWESPRSGTRYPARWRLRVPAAALDLVVEPLVADQELDVTIRYWEGAVRARGTTDGRGYVELTGYAEPARRELPRQ